MPRPKPRTLPSALAAALLATLLGACAESESPPVAEDPPAESLADELAAHHGQVCPDQLPQPADESYGFGTTTPAESAPDLPAPEKAWVCQYQPAEVGPGPDGDGTTWGWKREGRPRPVDETLLPGLATALARLKPSQADAMCTADLGPRWMLVYSHATDLTGVVIDAFGCRDVRLTDEPFEVVPGDSRAEGIVPGTLQAPAGLLDTVEQAVPTR